MASFRDQDTRTYIGPPTIEERVIFLDQTAARRADIDRIERRIDGLESKLDKILDWIRAKEKYGR